MNQKIRDRAIRVLEIAKGMAEKIDRETGTYSASNDLEGIQLHFAGYAEPGYYSETGIVASGSWNGELTSRLEKIFETMGIDVIWSESWEPCSDCYALVRTQPDHYGWLPAYMWIDGEYVCCDCVAKHADDFLQKLEDNPDNALTLRNVDPCEHGYRKLDEVYENGFHTGQTDDPRNIAKELRDKGISRFLFRITESGQFDIRFVVYVHEDECELLSKTEENEADKESYTCRYEDCEESNPVGDDDDVPSCKTCRRDLGLD